MFQRYSEELRRGLFFARAYALAAEAPVVGWEHLLVGVVEVTPHLGLSSETVLSRLQLRRPTKEPGQIPFSSTVEQLCHSATSEADQLGHYLVCPEHVILALLNNSSCQAGEILQAVGLRHEMVVESANRAAV